MTRLAVRCEAPKCPARTTLGRCEDHRLTPCPGCDRPSLYTWCAACAPRDLHDDHKPKPEGDKR